MANVLFLTHRIPYPPDKGDKIIGFNFLRHLAAGHSVYLGAFVDNAEDREHVDKVKSLCADVKLIDIQPLPRRLWSARALLRDESLSEVYHRSAELQRWIDEMVPRHRITAALAYCSAMAPYLMGSRFAALRRVAHFADVDSEKWKAYADKQQGVMGWIYGREARTLLQLEHTVARNYDITSFVSDADAALFKQLAPDVTDRIRVIPNGVDIDYFDPGRAYTTPFVADRPAIVFTGAMDYWPNVDAVSWFATEVFSRIRQTMPTADFWIVGSSPTRQVTELRAIPGVVVTGRVPDVRPYLAHAAAVVAPLRVARGVQNKVLEAYAMARPVVLSSAAANGLLPAPFIGEATHDDPERMAAAVRRALKNDTSSDTNRNYVMDNYSWSRTFSLLDQALRLN